jgi:hypothetical protein
LDATITDISEIGTPFDLNQKILYGSEPIANGVITAINVETAANDIHSYHLILIELVLYNLFLRTNIFAHIL